MNRHSRELREQILKEVKETGNRVLVAKKHGTSCSTVASWVRIFFILAFIDVFLRRVISAHVGLRCQAGDLCNTLARALLVEGITAGHGLVIRSSYGPQMTANELSRWLAILEEKLSHKFIPV